MIRLPGRSLTWGVSNFNALKCRRLPLPSGELLDRLSSRRQSLGDLGGESSALPVAVGRFRDQQARPRVPV